jgi:LacI family transcriptional regulator
MPTLAEIAHAAGISKSTASRALRGHPLLPATTITRVSQVAAKLGYRRNALVGEVMRRIRGRGRFTALGQIAYLTFDSTPHGWRSQPTFEHFFAGATERATQVGLGVEPFWMQAPGMTPRRAADILEARGISGLLIGPTTGWAETPALDLRRFCAVKIGTPFPDLALPCAGHHHLRGMNLALAELARRGYRRPGLVLRNYQEAKTGGAWSAGYFHHQQNLPARDRVPPLWLEKLSAKTFAAWFRRHRPDVVVGLGNYIPEWLDELGVRVPRDAGYVDLDRCTPDRAGIDQRSAAIGAAAVDLLLGRLLAHEHGVTPSAPLLLFEGVWVDGPTVRAASGRGRSTGARATRP